MFAAAPAGDDDREARERGGGSRGTSWRRCRLAGTKIKRFYEQRTPPPRDEVRMAS